MTKFETICDEAARLFARNGVDAVSMRDVADACGITAAALYYHFSSKEELYEEVGRAQFDLFMGRLKAARDALPPGNETPAQVLALVFDVVLADPTLFVLTQRDLHRCDKGERYAQSRGRFARAQVYLRQTLTRYQGKDADDRDVMALACIVTGYCEYVHADTRSHGPDRDAFIAEQRDGLVRLTQRAFEMNR